jgi:hypothetical protein
MIPRPQIDDERLGMIPPPRGHGDSGPNDSGATLTKRLTVYAHPACPMHASRRRLPTYASRAGHPAPRHADRGPRVGRGGHQTTRRANARPSPHATPAPLGTTRPTVRTNTLDNLAANRPHRKRPIHALPCHAQKTRHESAQGRRRSPNPYPLPQPPRPSRHGPPGRSAGRKTTSISKPRDSPTL